MNFASGYKPILFLIPRIREGYAVINPRLEAYFSSSEFRKQPPARGITVVDFANRELCRAIIQANTFP